MGIDFSSSRYADGQSVAATGLCVFGDTNWTEADDNTSIQRLITVTVCDGDDCYCKVVAYTASFSGDVSSTDFTFKVTSGSYTERVLAPGQILLIISAGTSTVNAVEIGYQNS